MQSHSREATVRRANAAKPLVCNILCSNELNLFKVKLINPFISTVRAQKVLYKDDDIELRRDDIITLPPYIVQDLPPEVQDQDVIRVKAYTYDPQFKEIFFYVEVYGFFNKKKNKAFLSDIKQVWFEYGNPPRTE